MIYAKSERAEREGKEGRQERKTGLAETHFDLGYRRSRTVVDLSIAVPYQKLSGSTNVFLCLKRFYNTGPPAYSDTSYSDILATVTVSAFLKRCIC